MGTTTAITFPALEAVSKRLDQLLSYARQIKSGTDLEPALPAAEFAGDKGLPGNESNHNGLVEAAARRVFQATLARGNIQDPDFVDVCNLLDILSVCGDQGQCEVSLAWALIEELFDSQSIAGCRIVFNYLESRRERLTSKNFGSKKLLILRTCNELLRRLSRAEDTVFCGRVYIFLFQSFPLGDKSQVNLRGEFHTENITTFETADPAASETITDPESKEVAEDIPMTDASATEPSETVKVKVSAPDAQAVDNALPNETTKSPDELYPVFWTLQKAFSNPPTVFESQYLSELKNGLEETLAMFKRVPRVIQAAANQEQRGVKRKAGEAVDDFASTYNPKYLTSRELFSLELSDLAFQRHILVQALILIDFLLSLTDKSRSRLAHITTSKALQYPYTLNEADTLWALKMRDSIKDHLQAGETGKFYYRMVETVLSRDKNWVRWKMEGCPSIAKNPVDAQEYISAKSGARSACTGKRLRPTPMGSLDLAFLADAENLTSLQALKQPERFAIPTAETLMKGIENDALDIDMAMTDEEKDQLQEAQQNKTWRLLRVMAKTKLKLFNSLGETQKLDVFFETGDEGDDGAEAEELKDVSTSGEASAETAESEGVEQSQITEESICNSEIPATLEAPASDALKS